MVILDLLIFFIICVLIADALSSATQAFVYLKSNNRLTFKGFWKEFSYNFVDFFCN